MTETGPAAMPRTVRCRVCREDIREGARVCNKCNNPQNWAVHLYRWKEVLTALLALAPFYSAAISLRQLAVEEAPAPKIRAVTLSCGDTVRIQIAVANVGTAAGVIRSPQLRQLGGSAPVEPFALDIDRNEGGPGASRVVKAGETLELNLVRRVSGAEAPPMKDPGGWTVIVPYSGFGGESDVTEARLEACAAT
jgi:hypothetical protein